MTRTTKKRTTKKATKTLEQRVLQLEQEVQHLRETHSDQLAELEADQLQEGELMPSLCWRCGLRYGVVSLNPDLDGACEKCRPDVILHIEREANKTQVAPTDAEALRAVWRTLRDLDERMGATNARCTRCNFYPQRVIFMSPYAPAALHGLCANCEHELPERQR